jgi:hypothetical protein
MKLNLNFEVCSLSGDPIEDASGKTVTVGEAIANSLVRTSKNSVKFFDWAIKLNKGEDLEIDVADKRLLEDFVTSDETLNNLVKGPVLKVLGDLK